MNTKKICFVIKYLVLLTLALLFYAVGVFCLFQKNFKNASAIEYTAEYDLSIGSVNITEEGDYRIFQSDSSQTSNTITISANCSVMLSEVSILAGSTSAMSIIDCAVVLYLERGTQNIFYQDNIMVPIPESSFSSGYTGLAAINVNSDSSLTIANAESETMADGVLMAQGASGKSLSVEDSSGGSGAGIGGNGGFNSEGEPCGRITIQSGSVRAVGGATETNWGGAAAGIGGGGGGRGYQGGICADVEILGGKVSAQGGSSAYSGCGGHGIGMGGYGGTTEQAQATSTLTINNGVVMAIGGDNTNDGEAGAGVCFNKVIIDKGNVQITAGTSDSEEPQSDIICDSIVNPSEETVAVVYAQLEEVSEGEILECKSIYYTFDITIMANNYIYIFFPINEQVDVYFGNNHFYATPQFGVKTELVNDTPVPQPTGFTLNFYTDGADEEISPMENLTIIPMDLPQPTKADWNFAGWYTDDKFVEEILGGEPLDGNTTIYAKWVNNYTIYFITNVPDEEISPIDDAATIPTVLPSVTRVGYQFLGWFMDEEFSEQVVYGKTLSEDINLYAKWGKLKFLLNFNCLSEGVIAPVSISVEKIPDVLPNPVREGYTFSGWFLEQTFEYPAYGGYELLENTTIYAKWAEVHVHEWSEWEYFTLDDGMYRSRRCTACDVLQTEKIQGTEQLAPIINQLIESPNEEILNEVKEELIQTASDYVHNCDGVQAQEMINTLSGRIDEFSLSDGVGQKLLETYADALSGVRVLKAYDALLKKMTEEFNGFNTTLNYTKKSMENLKEGYDYISARETDGMVAEDVAMLENIWTYYKDLLRTVSLKCDNGLLITEDGFDKTYALNISEVSPTEIDSTDIKNHSILAVYDVIMTINEEVSDGEDGKTFVVRIKATDKNLNQWKIKIAYVAEDGTVKYINAETEDGYIIFNATELTRFAVVYSEPFSIIPFIIMCVVLLVLSVCYFVVKKKNYVEASV